MATENGFFTNQTQFQNDPNVSQRDNLKGFYGTAVRPAYVEDLVAKAEEAAAKSYDYSQKSKQYRDEAEVIRDETQAINDQTDQVYNDTVQVYNDTVGVYNDTVVQANNAASSANDAAQSEAGAANSAVIAAGFAADAEAAFDNFNDLYLGAKSSDPTTDNDGNPLQVGATYWNSTTHDLRFWSGATWDIPEQTAIQAANTAVSASDDAQVSATNAATSESNAAQSAADALASQNAASLAASSANTSANNAASSASDAATSEANAATSASNAATSETNAAQSAADAQQSADDAAAIVPNLQSQIYDVVDDVTEIEWKQFVRNEATLNQMREQNKSVRAASGFDHYGLHRSSVSQATVINEGLWTFVHGASTPANANLLTGKAGDGTGEGAGKTPNPVIHIAGFTSEMRDVGTLQVNSGGQSAIKFPEAPDGTVTYNSATGEVIQHADAATAFALADTSDDIEVVINRVDMFGAEFFLEEVSQANPFVYPKGMIQSQATSMNGITTTTSNRPVTYYAVYDGDTGSQGLGVDFWAATDEQKKALVSDETNNIFMLDDGRLVQWRMRQRTIAGAGNGDFDSISPVANATVWLAYGHGLGQGNRYVSVQGADNTVPPYFTGVSHGNIYGNINSSYFNRHRNNLGVFQAVALGGGDTDNAVNGECYFHVWGVVPRLNQGAYHPSFNPMGTATVETLDGSGSHTWYTAPNPVASVAECFSRSRNNGNIGSTSGRPDGKSYDAIYASGQGGVIDYRLPSWDMSSKEEASKVFQKVVNGSYRGEEKVPFTEIASTQATITGTWGNDSNRVFTSSNYSGDTARYSFKTIGVAVDGGVVEVRARGDSANIEFRNDGVILLNNILNTAEVAASLTGLGTGLLYAVTTNDTNSTVSGEFTMVDVIGNPTEILATPALANGWLGGWVPYIHSGAASEISEGFTRKCLDSTIVQTYTDNNGGTWSTSSASIDTTLNKTTEWSQTGRVHVFPYTAFAKQTKESDNTAPLNSVEGIGEVFTSYNYRPNWGNTFIESLLGKVATSDYGSSGTAHEFNRVTKHLLNPSDGRLGGWTGYDWDVLTHEPVSLPSPQNDSPVVKSLWYQTANNQQVSMNFAWNELVWKDFNGTVITVINDQNSVTCNTYDIVRFNDPTGTLFGSIQIRQGSNLYSANLAGQCVLPDGRVVGTSGATTGYDYWAPFMGNGWGDDSTIRITNGTSTYTNLNGDTCLYGTAELAIPYGYTKNQARASEQTEGVDL